MALPDRRSFHTRRCDVFETPKNKEEALIKAENDAECARFHESRSQDAGLIAEARPEPACPICGKSGQAIRWGKAKSGLPRYRCKRCGRTFTPASGGLIDQRKLPTKTVVKFMVNILTGTSVSEASKAAKISMTTALCWMGKVFAALASWQSSIVLSGGVYVDEKYFTVAHSEVELRPDGGRCRGLSRNQWCVAVALGPGKKAMAMVEGKGKSSSAKVLDAFRNHIKPGSALIHDLDFSHKKLIAELSLADEGEKAIYKFNCQSGLDPMNAYCSNMEDFVRLHRGMNKHRLQDWTNLFSFKFGCPGNALQKAEKLLDLLLKCKEIVRYRD
jgi:transposase-like protein